VLISPDWLERASWEDQKVFVAATRAQVEASPEWDPRHPPHREYEGGLHEHYGRAPYWDREAPPGPGGS
jgi:hypothetical protein